MAPQPRRVSVELEPVGRRTTVPVGATVLSAAQEVGVALASVCGGQGVCGSCRIRLIAGGLTAPSLIERQQLTPVQLHAGWRLACQARVTGETRIEIPPESLTAAQRLQLEGRATEADLDPPVVGIDVSVDPPDLHDLRADSARLLDAIDIAERPRLGLRLLSTIPATLRGQDWSVRIAVNRDRGEIVALRQPGSPLLGLAIDIGTTKLAAYLVDLATGETRAQTGTMNPQIAHGEDVLTRIAHANTTAAAQRELHDLLVGAVDEMTACLCQQAGAAPEAIVDCVAVGNTAMHHLFAGLPVRQLGEAPYVPATSDPIDALAADVGLTTLAPTTSVYLPPLIAGYVGADHVAMLLAIGMADQNPDDPGTTLALDIGTNTELSLLHDGRLWSCSTASGPAFEGAHISNGMRAAAGAIERVQYLDGRFLVQTVDGRPAIGLCGSGILDAVAESLQAGIINRRGGLTRDHPLVTRSHGTTACTLVCAADSGHDRDVVFTRADVSEIQLAKGAIHAGTELLLEAAGIEPHDLEQIAVAGAFGTYLDLASAIRVGLLPDLPHARFRQVGNAAGAGARRLLLSRRSRLQAIELPAQPGTSS